MGSKKRGFKQEPSRKDRSRWKRLWDWTEFGKKTGWQWLELLSALAIPVILAIVGYWFTGQQTESQQAFEAQQRALEERRAEAERKLAEQRAQDEALQAYLDQMSTLLIEEDLRTSNENSEVRTLARARTLTVLERLDPIRKAAVIQFLGEAGLVQRVEGRQHIIRLNEADLSEADLSRANLNGADLSGANLSSANLNGADLSGADLSDADLSNAELVRTKLRSADLSHAALVRADLNLADLAGADLSDAYLLRATLAGANLTDADLSAYLPHADLSQADLRGVKGITNEQLEQQAKTLSDATMPNGQTYEDWLKSKGRGEDGENSGPL